MEAPKSPWRYPHLMFRDSRKHKSVSFKASNGERSRLDLNLRREDSKDSSISSLSSQHPNDLRTLSVPPFQDHFGKKFKRTDSSESSNSSLASFGQIFGRKNSHKKVAAAHKQPHPHSPLAAGHVTLVTGHSQVAEQ